MAERRIVASGWYAANLGAGYVALEEEVRARTRLLRGLGIYRAARRFQGAALLRLERGALTALTLAAIFGGASIVVLELIPDRPPRRAWKRLLARLRFVLFERPAVRRGMRAGQVLSEPERRRIAAHYGVPEQRLAAVGWALCRTGETERPAAGGGSGVLSSGRAACDWETLFAAAARAEWALTVVCGARDRDRVEALNRDGRATVLSEISRDQHDRLMREAAVFAMVMVDDGLSSGQVRLMTATELGTPVVVSAVETLTDYVVDGETALTVPVGDPAALRARIDALLADPERRARLAAAALDRGRSRTYADYFRDVGAMIESALDDQRTGT